MDERIVVAIVYILAGVAVIAVRPGYANLYIILATPVLNYYFVKQVERKIEKKPFNLVSDLLLFVACLLIVFLIAMFIAPVIASVKL